MLIKKEKDFVYTYVHVKGQTDDHTVMNDYTWLLHTIILLLCVCAVDVTFRQEGYVGDILVCSNLVCQQNRAPIVL